MLQPEYLPPHEPSSVMTHSPYESGHSRAKATEPDLRADVKALVEELLPQGISPAKRVVVEQMVLRWQTRKR